MLTPSGGPLYYAQDVPGGNKPDLLAALHAAVTSCGWDPTTISGGHKYTITSPQMLKAKVVIKDDGETDSILVQMMSFDEARVGIAMRQGVSADRLYALHVGPCQLFNGVFGQMRPTFGSGFTAIQLGIPKMFNAGAGTTCDLPDIGSATAEEAWWCASDTTFGPTGTNSFRTGSWDPNWWSACYNGDLIGTGLEPNGWLRLLPKGLGAVGRSFVRAPKTLLWGADVLYQDPLIAWGRNTAPQRARARGVLYDAVQPSDSRDVDAFYTVDGIPFVNYQADTPAQDLAYWSSLFLLPGYPAAAGGGAYAYDYET